MTADRAPAKASAGTAATAGIHLPQAGPAASGDALVRAGALAEELGYSAAWFSDHLAVQRGATYPPSAYIYEPLVAMAWVAAATNTIELGTSVLVLPMRRPLVMAKMLGSIDLLSGGRVIVGAAGGYIEREFAALGVAFAERGPRTDEAVEMLRVLWTQDPITQTFPVHGAVFEDMRTKPQPGRHIPIWIGGTSAPALRRAVRVGDGWHGIVRSTDLEKLAEVASQVSQLREGRPEREFVLSVRAFWDGLEDNHDQLLRCMEELHRLGVSHVMAEPRQRELDDYLRSMERLAAVFDRAGVSMRT